MKDQFNLHIAVNKMIADDLDNQGTRASGAILVI